MKPPKRLLVVDANIISHALTVNQTPAYIKLFAILETDYKFVVTGHTKYELMCTSDREHRQRLEEYLEQNMAYVTLSKQLMDFAARLSFLYGKHSSTKGFKISMGDIVNAAFSIAYPSALLTIDNNDYPRPFFSEITRKRVSYTSKKGHNVMDTVCVLEPDIENVKECFAQHDV